MTTRWNPGNPNVAGDEWFGSAAIPEPIASLIGRGPTITARSSQSVTAIQALLTRASGLSGTTPTLASVDVYDLANPVGPDTQSWVIALPESDDTNAAGWVKSDQGVETAYDANAHNFVAKLLTSSSSLGGDITHTGSIATTTLTTTGLSDDEVGSLVTGGTVAAGTRITAVASSTSATVSVSQTVASASLTRSRTMQQLRYQGVNPTTAPQVRYFAGHTALYDGDSGASGASLTSKRISSIEVVAVVENSSSHSVRFVGQLVIAGVAYTADSGPEVITFGSPLTRVRFAFYSNPATGLPWTNADAIALQDGTNSFGIAVITKSGSGNFIVTSTFLQFRTLTERRVATGHGSMIDGEDWVNFPLLAPVDNSSAAWSKVSGHEYLFLYSLTAGSVAAQLTKIDTTATAGIGNAALTDAGVAGWSLDHGAVPLAQNDDTEGQIATVMLIGATVSLDSLPYGAVTAIAAGSSVARTQIISTHSSQDYGSAIVLVSRGSGGQEAGLAVSVKRVSDDAVLLGPTTIATTDIPADGKFHIARVLFTPATLSAAAPVYIEVVSSATTVWLLSSLQTRLPSLGVADPESVANAAASIGGVADKGDGITVLDFPWSIIVSPAKPTGLTATAATLANRPTLAGGGTGLVSPQPATIGYVALDWTSTSLGGSFDHYDVQRQNAAGVWEQIATITLEASSYLNDFDIPRGQAGAHVALAYRVRVVAADGGISAWATFSSVHVEVGNCADVVCSSNADPASSLAFRDLTPTHSWDQLETARGKMQPILGRDYPVGFWPAEAGGEAFSRKLAIAYLDPAVVAGGAVTPDRAVFDPVLDLLQDRTLPYICFSDAWGRTWLTSPAVSSPGPTREEPEGRYSIVVLFTQVESSPVAIEVATPWHP